MRARSIIGPTTVIRGNLSGDGDVEILGRVEGGVTFAGDVTLGEHAAVLGDIGGASLVIAGAVQGELRGAESVTLESTARVIGDLTAPRIGIADGALVRGNVRTDGASSGAAPRARSAARAEPAR
ncbi:MAG: polymer-forming cytoskeletal protein, partial [Sorangiineae bacterium]|nr:polymer-forming cytoskeletal protein [Sorangiineae bacterium]